MMKQKITAQPKAIEFKEVEQEIRDHLNSFRKKNGIKESLFLINSIMTISGNRLPKHLIIDGNLPMVMFVGKQSGRFYCFALKAIIKKRKKINNIDDKYQCYLCKEKFSKECEQCFISINKQSFNVCKTCNGKFIGLQISHNIYMGIDEDEELPELQAKSREYKKLIKKLLAKAKNHKVDNCSYSYAEELKENANEAMRLYDKYGFDHPEIVNKNTPE